MNLADRLYDVLFLGVLAFLVAGTVYLLRNSSLLRMTRRTVIRKVRSLWPNGVEADRALVELDRYGPDTDKLSRTRVQLAILKLSNGSLEELKRWVDIALKDSRDPLLYAEYPGEAEAPSLGAKSTPEERRRIEEIRSRDRQKYIEWLRS